MSYEAVLQTALDAAGGAVAVHTAHLGAVPPDAWSEKGIADFVTHVDRDAEARILERIHATFPGHTILAEEAATANGAGAIDLPDAEWLWIVDPLDGTTNFLHRYPMYGVSIAVMHEGELVAGVVMSGPSQETWWATRRGGAFRNGKPIAVSSIHRLKLALIGTGFPFKTPELLDAYLAQFAVVLRNSAGIRRAGSAALDLCHVAAGWFDGFWELSLAPWDVAAGTLIVREAGGVVTTPDGGADVLGKTGLLAGNPEIHRALGQLLRTARASEQIRETTVHGES